VFPTENFNSICFDYKEAGLTKTDIGVISSILFDSASLIVRLAMPIACSRKRVDLVDKIEIQGRVEF